MSNYSFFFSRTSKLFLKELISNQKFTFQNLVFITLYYWDAYIQLLIVLGL